LENEILNAIDSIADRQRSAYPEVEGDYRVNGILYCGKCKTPKEKEYPIPWADTKKVLPVLCDCQKAKYQSDCENLKKTDFEMRVEKLKREGITDNKYLSCSFENDDSPKAKNSVICRRYAEKFGEIEKKNIGLLLYGDVGTGKTFYAACIANYLLGKCVPASITNFPDLLSLIFKDKEAIGKLQAFSLLVIDDLGVERNSEYSMEQIYNVIDARVRSGKPMIVTTNLSAAELTHPGDLAHKRIYDRIMEACPVMLKFEGNSRRGVKACQKAAEAKKILGV